MRSLKNLAQQTEKVLLELSQFKYLERYIFVGGSALAVYYNHRISKDIDLFTWQKSVDFESLIKLLNKHFRTRFQFITTGNDFSEIILDGVRVTFFANDWEVLKQGEPLTGYIKIAPLTLLTAMKINTLYLRATFRDYYDIYMINRNSFSVEEMYNIGFQFFPGINKKLFQMALLFTDDINEEEKVELKLTEKITLKEIQKHFEKEVRNWLK